MSQIEIPSEAEEPEPRGKNMTAARTRDELEQLREELREIAEKSDEARRQRADRRAAVIARYRAIGDSVQRRARQAKPFLLLAAFGLGVLIGRLLTDKRGAR
jgi:hypothetical protein